MVSLRVIWDTPVANVLPFSFNHTGRFLRMFMVSTIDPALSERMQEHVVRANLHMRASCLLAGIERVLSSRFLGYSDGLSAPGAMLDVASKTERFILNILKDYMTAYLPERAAVMYPGHTPATTKVRVAEFEGLLQGYQSAMRSYPEWGFETIQIVKVGDLSHSVLDRILCAELLGMEVRIAEATLGFAAALPVQPALVFAGIPLNFGALNCGARSNRGGGGRSFDLSTDADVLMVVRTQQSRELMVRLVSAVQGLLTPCDEGQKIGSNIVAGCANANVDLQVFSNRIGEQITKPKPESTGNRLFARAARWFKNHTR